MITLSQDVYINAIAFRFNLKTSHPASTPLDPNLVLSKDLFLKKWWGKETNEEFALPYCHGIYNVHLYVPLTRHWSAIQQLIWYLLGTQDMVLVLGGSHPITLTRWVDVGFMLVAWTLDDPHLGLSSHSAVEWSPGAPNVKPQSSHQHVRQNISWAVMWLRKCYGYTN